MTKPTHTLTCTKFGSNIKTMLYGVVTPEQLADAQREILHRAEQLSPHTTSPQASADSQRHSRDQESRPKPELVVNPFQSGGGR